ncbi:MAG: hypothetical protein V1695_00760 [Candidatus Uhrbacteria bacterium]
MDSIWKLVLYLGIVFFFLPLSLFVGLSVMMLKELMDEEDTIKTIIVAGLLTLLLGALFLVLYYLFH